MGRPSKTSGTKTIKIARDLRIATAAATYGALLESAGVREQQIALDARQVEKIDAAGIQAILAGRKALAQAGKKLSWAGRSPRLEAAAELLGLAEALGLRQ